MASSTDRSTKEQTGFDNRVHGEPAREAQSGLPAWRPAELPVPPRPKGLQWLATVGPGVIVLGVSIGSGEFLLGPATFVKHGLTLLWVTLVASVLQTIFNTELMRYTLATGEPAFTGFMRTKPHATFWAWVYAGFYFLQIGWPAWAGAAAGAIYYLFVGRLAGADQANIVYLIGVGTFLICFTVLLVGRRIERTLELLNWVLLIAIFGGFIVLGVMYVPGQTWAAAGLGFFGIDATTFELRFLPQGADFFLLGAFAAYSGAGGVTNLALANWARDKGYGMGQVSGYISGAVGGEHVTLAHSGFRILQTPDAMTRWRGWWRIVRADQWAIFFVGSLLGMALPALLYVTFLPPGTEIRGLAIAAALAGSMSQAAGPVVGMVVATMGAWLLLKTQLDSLDGMTRSITDILWTGSPRVRAMRNGDVRVVYYSVLVVIVVWGIIALRLAQPIILLQLGANIAGIVMVLSSMHLLYVNTRLLPVEFRPPLWRRVALVCMTLFYGTFVGLWIRSLIIA
jgi:hypothetical protein